MNEKAVFTLLKAFRPKMRVDGKSQIRKGPHCPLTLLGKALGVDCQGADDYSEVQDELCLDEGFVDRFIYAADYSLKEIHEDGNDPEIETLRRNLFKVLALPKSKL